MSLYSCQKKKLLFLKYTGNRAQVLKISLKIVCFYSLILCIGKLLLKEIKWLYQNHILSSCRGQIKTWITKQSFYLGISRYFHNIKKRFMAVELVLLPPVLTLCSTVTLFLRVNHVLLCIISRTLCSPISHTCSHSMIFSLCILVLFTVRLILLPFMSSDYRTFVGLSVREMTQFFPM